MYLTSPANLVGSTLGISGLALFFTGLVQGVIIVPIVAGLYTIGVLATPKSQKHEMVLRSQFKAVDIRNELEKLLNRVKRRVPKEAFEKALSIRNTILTILPQIEDLNSSDYNVFIIQQTALDYLPSALEAYINLPRAYANYQPIKDGKTARQLLLEQLDLLDREIKLVVQEMYQNNTAELIAHGQFLKDKFGNPHAVFKPTAPQPMPLPEGEQPPPQQPPESPQTPLPQQPPSQPQPDVKNS